MDAFLALPPEHPLSYIQIIGYIAMALGIAAFSQKDDVWLKVLMVCMTAVLITHFVLLGTYVAAVSSFIAGSRAGLSLLPWVMKRRRSFTIGYVALTCVLSALTYTQWLDVFPFMTAMIGSYALFYLSGLKLRYAFVVMGGLWMLHNILAQSYGPAVMEAFILTANLITIYRLMRDEKSRPV